MQPNLSRKFPDGAAEALPLPTLLSHALVAFTIEFDNEFERQMPHRTTTRGRSSGVLFGPWLGSLVLWSTCMRFVDEQGVTVRELERLARTKTNLNGMERWGYVVIAPDPADPRPKPPRADWVIRATPGGRKAQEVWRPLFGAVEQRWEERFGTEEVAELRKSLQQIVEQLDAELPDCMPILGYGLFSLRSAKSKQKKAGKSRQKETEKEGTSREDVQQLTLAALLSRVLLAFAEEFESDSPLSLAMCADVLRVLDEKGVRLRDMPLLSGVSKEAISMGLGILRKRSLVVIETEATGSKAKIVRLTPKGREAQRAYHERVAAIEESWFERFGKDALHRLRTLLEALAGEPTAERSPLFQGLEPYPDGWRAGVRRPQTLPHYPLVLHRGGYPDGS
jgi:DNA-binding MarR family transcriptional regulator